MTEKLFSCSGDCGCAGSVEVTAILSLKEAVCLQEKDCLPSPSRLQLEEADTIRYASTAVACQGCVIQFLPLPHQRILWHQPPPTLVI